MMLKRYIVSPHARIANRHYAKGNTFGVGVNRAPDFVKGPAVGPYGAVHHAIEKPWGAPGEINAHPHGSRASRMRSLYAGGRTQKHMFSAVWQLPSREVTAITSGPAAYES